MDKEKFSFIDYLISKGLKKKLIMKKYQYIIENDGFLNIEIINNEYLMPFF
ncbi:hypothetical protein [Epilithonimonas hominis]|uniref:hypothetical protein n=1 Tax=Epilithonimonas hominis TaxID=420404 RepID=UPI00160BF467|nr:hypothetical protein [Epilithonimonas hominis]